jgi:cytoplasmic iron level regulating protein YaaA (DUF328/UPF0246 family)
MLHIISPAKSLELEKPFPSVIPSDSLFHKESATLAGILKKLNTEDLIELMDISPKLAELNFSRNQLLKFPIKDNTARPALFTFDGEVYTGLDAFSMKKKQIDFAQNHLRILSGLYGLLKPLDLILPYRLEMGTELKNKEGKNLYQFWGEKITQALNDDLKKLNSDTLINLASNEYFNVIHPKKLKGKIIQIEFKEKKGDAYKVVSFTAKKARGLMSRFIIDHQLKKVNDLKAFDIEQYQFNPHLSKEATFVFTR